MHTTLYLEGVELEVTFEVLSTEVNNVGHPDLRLPDEAEEIQIQSVILSDWDDTVLTNLIKEQIDEND